MWFWAQFVVFSAFHWKRTVPVPHTWNQNVGGGGKEEVGGSPWVYQTLSTSLSSQWPRVLVNWPQTPASLCCKPWPPTGSFQRGPCLLVTAFNHPPQKRGFSLSLPQTVSLSLSFFLCKIQHKNTLNHIYAVYNTGRNKVETALWINYYITKLFVLWLSDLKCSFKKTTISLVTTLRKDDVLTT